MGEIDSLLTDTLTQWLDCFDDPELAESVYSQAFPLVDITAMSDNEILRMNRDSYDISPPKQQTTGRT